MKALTMPTACVVSSCVLIPALNTCVCVFVCVCVYVFGCVQAISCLSCAISCTYNFRNDNPFLTYGEQVSVLVQDFILFTLVTSYQGMLV
jgi:hypothetical protein